LTDLLPFLEIQGPDGQEQKIELSKERVTVGRFLEFNDVALDPDPQQLVTRKVHCSIERDGDGWWVVDNGAVNKTLLQKGPEVKIVSRRALLGDGDVVRILGRLTEDGQSAYWEITFRDPLRTRHADVSPRAEALQYDWVQAKLFRVERASCEEIRTLRPQEHKLIRYMDQRNQANGNTPVLCAHDELIAAIWGDEYGPSIEQLNHLIWELRKKIEPDPKEPRFLETVRGLGYRLITRAVDH
jgi:DNA-binding winged helix-turn-helix (wHTH) protein